MYKLVIADDERNIRHGLRDYIPWDTLGFEVVADFEDGEGVLEYVKKTPVDVILTDIKMQRMSGIEVAKYIFENMPRAPKVLFLSGYKEFDFARQAMQYNVYDYILKPTKNSEIIKLFEKIKLELDQEDTNSEADIQKEQLILDILQGTISNAANIKAKLDMLNIETDKSTSFAVITIKIKNYNRFFDNVWDYGKDRFFGALKNFMREGNGKLELIPLYRIGDIIPVFAIIREGLHKRDIELIFEEITCKIERELKVSISAVVKVTYQNYEALVSERPFLSILKDGNRDDLNEYANEMGNLLMRKFVGSDNDSYKTLLSRIKEDFSAENLDKHKLALILVCNVLIIKFQKSHMGYVLPLLDRGIVTIRQARSKDEIDEAVDSLFLELSKVNANHILGTPTLIVARIKEYIENNFDKDITLENLSEQVYLSMAYVSKLFKKHEGENITDYIMKVRMEHARKLLGFKNIKVYEICGRVGYKSTKYFYKAFKKYTGKTPSEYRDTL